MFNIKKLSTYLALAIHKICKCPGFFMVKARKNRLVPDKTRTTLAFAKRASDTVKLVMWLQPMEE